MFLLETNNGETSNQYLTALKDVWRNQSATVYGYSYKATEMISPHPASSYAALMMFAQIVNESYLQDTSGKYLARSFLNKTFHLNTGDIRIDEHGDRIPAVALRQMDHSTSMYQDVISQDAMTFELSQLSSIS
ncbi:hypothetical protein RvY_12063-1 [Ramazzottius varieornatus]|uniref:Uncharacterized protein n=1 Tax=Ramazzottius varieornatus TaxID=947166 RepID=A0A1D1VMH2_RAMVA|nr:hypothetical protein RvY_12063-1 [Ramazzottius varieornatus]